MCAIGCAHLLRKKVNMKSGLHSATTMTADLQTDAAATALTCQLRDIGG